MNTKAFHLILFLMLQFYFFSLPLGLAQGGYYVPTDMRKNKPIKIPAKSTVQKPSPMKSKIKYQTIGSGSWFAQDALANVPGTR
jgi:hypothetical protein